MDKGIVTNPNMQRDFVKSYTNKELLEFLFKLLNDTHFKIVLTAINMFGLTIIIFYY